MVGLRVSASLTALTGPVLGAGTPTDLYVPAPLLKKGVNELIVFELHGMEAPVVEFRDKPTLG